MGCKSPLRSRKEISFGCKCSNFYTEWNLICKQLIRVIMSSAQTESLAQLVDITTVACVGLIVV